jgi:hypothetical protein
MELTSTEVDYVRGECLTNLLTASVEGDGWFMAAPGYEPYGNYVWHRDNAECIMALDEYAATFGEGRLYETTGRAILRSFLYFESKQKGVDKLSGMKVKLTNPEFYNASNHPHARLARDGQELPGPWNNVQFDSVARMVVALAKHLSLTRDAGLLQKCKSGLGVALQYLTQAIWDESGPQRALTVCANEWEERDEPHLRGPLFSSVVGLLHASGKYSRSVLQEYVDFKGLDLEGYEKQTESMLKGFFVRDDVIRMIKRFDESPVGVCSTALWLLTSFDAFPPGGNVFDRTLDSLMRNRHLGVELRSIDGASGGEGSGGGGDNTVVALRRYELSQPERQADGAAARDGHGHIDTYWGGQAWIITTAQLATALAMRGDVPQATDLLSVCLDARDAEGSLPEQFDGTYHDQAYHEKWREWSHACTPAPRLAWSHAEVLRAYAAIYRAS